MRRGQGQRLRCWWKFDHRLGRVVAEWVAAPFRLPRLWPLIELVRHTCILSSALTSTLAMSSVFSTKETLLIAKFFDDAIVAQYPP
jgi:hypothetical protein